MLLYISYISEKISINIILVVTHNDDYSNTGNEIPHSEKNIKGKERFIRSLLHKISIRKKIQETKKNNKSESRHHA